MWKLTVNFFFRLATFAPPKAGAKGPPGPHPLPAGEADDRAAFISNGEN